MLFLGLSQTQTFSKAWKHAATVVRFSFAGPPFCLVLASTTQNSCDMSHFHGILNSAKKKKRGIGNFMRMVILRRFPSQIPNLCGSDKHLQGTANLLRSLMHLFSITFLHRDLKVTVNAMVCFEIFYVCQPTVPLPMWKWVWNAICNTNIGFECPQNMFNF